MSDFNSVFDNSDSEPVSSGRLFFLGVDGLELSNSLPDGDNSQLLGSVLGSSGGFSSTCRKACVCSRRVNTACAKALISEPTDPLEPDLGARFKEAISWEGLIMLIDCSISGGRDGGNSWYCVLRRRNI